MRRKFIILSAAILAVCAAGCGSENNEDPVPARTSYTNPLSAVPIGDPTFVKGDDGYFYLYSSEEVRGMPIMRSANLTDWKQIGIVFSDARRPKLDGMTEGGLWAPDVSRLGDRYIMYYAYAPANSVDGWGHGIGVAEADRPEGPWTDKGRLFLGGEIGVKWSIDPCFVHEDDGSNWLLWGSYYGIWAIELSADGLSVKPGAEKVHLAGKDGYGIEGAMIHKKDGKYYLFLSHGGTEYNEHYKLGVAVSDNLLGPYLTKAGKSVADGAPVDFFLAAGNGFISPGHCSEIFTDKNGTDWVFYHAWVEGHPEYRRLLMLDKIVWNDGWPSISDGYPTYESKEVPAL